MTNESNLGCCPASAIGVSSTHPMGTGKWIVIEGNNGRENMEAYVAGADVDEAGRLVVVFTDVFGVRSGNHRKFADALAHELKDENTCVIVPDLFRKNPALQPMFESKIGIYLGVPGMFWRLKRHYNAKNTVDKDIMQVVLPFLESKRPNLAKSGISLVGFCYGGWVIPKVIEKVTSMVTCAVTFHPAWNLEKQLHGGDETDLARACGSTPVLLMPAKDDPDVLKPGSEVLSILSAARNGVPEDEISIEFPIMTHGFVSRDDPSLKNQRSEQERAMGLCVNFLKEHSHKGQ
eukprot:CAMPEP_0197182930 /NCGR_PEP_ID=MMETSP1423-20130617/7053_1 /TAXON_ID=476441 /ORGANISM="Pseudo-nitzschia heimii, Strain UNC1101" /LENGTH=290 /DNA_ID=CAMNT_0042633435 /DNA_START=83 /DNA_END=955 /DNA_ORIENTATION=+